MIDLEDPPELLAPVLKGAAALFGGGLAIRRALWQSGLLRPERVGRPVISVGNLAVGGTGKTPLVIFLAQLLLRRGIAVAVVSRGYGAVDPPEPDRPLVVSEHGTPTGVGPERAGDEPILIASRTDASVVVSPDRVAAAKLAIGRLGAELILLDDAFQHWAIARDLDCVVLDARAPFGNGRLLPAGRLREPIEALERAQLLVLNHGSSVQEVGADLSRWPRVEVVVRATGLERLAPGARIEPASTLNKKRVALIAAIGQPQRFVDSVVGLGAEVGDRLFLRDHAAIDRGLLERFSAEARAHGAERILTTEKDAVRIGPVAEEVEALRIEQEVIAGGADLAEALEAFAR
jgi:tetraacyldisaccharide 4'-kinase